MEEIKNPQPVNKIDSSLLIAQGRDAELASRVMNRVWERMREYLDNREYECDTARSAENAADIVRCRQLLAAMQREITVMINRGHAAANNEKISLKEIERKQKMKDRIFSRL